MFDRSILRADSDGVATLTLNRPDKLNALNPAMFVELRGHLDAIADDESKLQAVLAEEEAVACDRAAAFA